MHNKPPTIQAIAPGSEVILVVTFALQCGHVIVIGLGPHRVLVTTTTCCGTTVGGGEFTGANPPPIPAKIKRYIFLVVHKYT